MSRPDTIASAALVYPRRAWRRLTSMRTALILLFLLAIAAVPGSILPQRPLNPSTTKTWIATHGWWGTLLDHLGMFDVFGSVWFSAIYLLLGLSLVGCLVPRLRVHLRALRTPPLPAPKRLERLPESAAFDTPGAPDLLAAQARTALRRRWRVKTRTEPGGAVTVSAEKGYLRETGNLIFHVALLAGLLAVGIDQLYHYEGTVIVQDGKAFCNTPLDLDSLRTGRFASGRDLAPFCIQLTKFSSTYTAVGEPTSFTADVTYSQGTNGTPAPHTITVNHPLRIDGDRVYLTGHGFAPRFTVRMPDGASRTSTATFLPTDASTLLSEGVVKLQGAGTGHDIAIQGLFAPDGIMTRAGLLTSASPALRNPMVGIFIYEGDLGLGNGVPQSVYRLDSGQIASGALRPIGTATLAIGQSKTLAGGVRVTFDGYAQFANFQISHNPAQNYLLFAVLAMLTGLIASLSIRRRRVWLRINPTDEADVACRVEIGGLARSDSGNFSTEFAAVRDRLRTAMTGPSTEALLEGADR